MVLFDTMNPVMKMISKQKDRRKYIQLIALNGLVPAEHLVRKIEAVVNFNGVYEMASGYYCKNNGQPAVDPVVLMKIVLRHWYTIATLNGIGDRGQCSVPLVLGV